MLTRQQVQNHTGEPKTDYECVDCHEAERREFDDKSIIGAHMLPQDSTAIRGLEFEIVETQGFAAGNAPTVTFKLSSADEPVMLEQLGYLALTYAGPTAEYTNRVTEVVYEPDFEPSGTIVDAGNGTYNYIFASVLPDDAYGTYAVAIEGYWIEEIKLERRISPAWGSGVWR